MARTRRPASVTVVAGRREIGIKTTGSNGLGLSRNDIGTGMTDDELAGFDVDVATRRAYRAAVGKRTRGSRQALRPEEWAEVQDADAMQRVSDVGRSARAERRLDPDRLRWKVEGDDHQPRAYCGAQPSGIWARP